MGFFPLESLFGGLTGSTDVYGRKPKPVDVPTAEMILEEASLANLANAPNIRKLASETNKFNLDESLAAFETIAPGISGARALEIGNITDSLKGILSPDVVSALERHAAARGIDRGTSGSQFDEFAELRDLGLSSLQEQQRGSVNLGRFTDTLARTTPRPVDTSQLFLDAPQWNPYGKFQNDLYNEQIRAAPDPAAAGAAAAEMALMQSMLGVYGGAGQNPIGQGAAAGGGRGAASAGSQWGGTYGEQAVGAGAFDF